MAVEFLNSIPSAASKYGVPTDILWGVYGVESSFGKNKSTSSAGAIGPFQFLPSTASRYGYPLTNDPNSDQFQRQADAAARYLADLFHQTGSWDAALHLYSGGGYGLSQVQAAAKSNPIANVGKGAIGNPDAGGVGGGVGGLSGVGGIQGTANALSSIPNAIASVWNSAVTDAKYAGVLLVVMGVAAYLMVHGITGVSARDAARKVTTP